MNARWRRSVGIVSLLAVTTVGITQEKGQVRLEGDPARREKLAAIQGKPAPEIEAAAWMNGKPVRLSDLRGKVIMLDFWGKW